MFPGSGWVFIKSFIGYAEAFEGLGWFGTGHPYGAGPVLKQTTIRRGVTDQRGCMTLASVAEWQLEHGSLCFFEIGAILLRISIEFSYHIAEFRMVLVEFPTPIAQ